MSLSFGNAAVPSGVFSDSRLTSSTSSFIAERRAYATFTYTGKGMCDNDPDPASIESGVQNSYVGMLTGPRLVPPPSLTSVDWSSDGANDIYDGYLWKATVNFTCYSFSQFNTYDTKFFQHFNKVSLTLGWIVGGVVETGITINGTIVDFQFSVNEKGHYDCSVTFSGVALEASAAFDLNLLTANTDISRIMGAQRQLGFPQSIVGYLKAKAMYDHKNTVVPAGNRSTFNAVGDSNFGKAMFTLNTTSWMFWNATQEVYYVSLAKLIQTINTHIPRKNGFEGISWNLNPSNTVTKKVKSANPMSVLNQNGDNSGDSAQYVPGAAFGWGALDSTGTNVGYFISFDTLEKIEKELIEDESDNPHSTKNTLIQFIRRVLDEVNSCMGQCIQLEMIAYGQSGQGTTHGYEIVDRKLIIQKLNPTVANPFSKSTKIRSVNIQSTIDSEMASIASAQAHSGKNQGVYEGVFGCTPSPPDIQKDKDELLTMYSTFDELDPSILSDCVQTLKKICNVSIKQLTGYKYGVTITITVDGYPSHLFGQTFRVAGLPTMLTKSNVYFIVLKQGHKYSNGDWTMDIEGQMMFDVGTAPRTDSIDPTQGGVVRTQPKPPQTAAEKAAERESLNPEIGGIFGSL